MAKITISDITSGFGSVTQINAGFDAIETELNDNVLYRTNPTGEDNVMNNDMDMNSNDLLNVGVTNTATIILAGTQVTSSTFTDSPTASQVTNVPSGNLEAVEVQAALDELQTDIDNSVRVFDTVALMVSDTDLVSGNIVQTAGYTTAGDGGDNTYEVVAASTGTDDGGSFIDLATLQAQGLFPGSRINVRQFGATGDGTTDDTAVLIATKDYAATSGLLRFEGMEGDTYLVSSELSLDSANLLFEMNNSIIKGDTSFPNTDNFVEITASGVTIQNGEVDGNRDNLVATFTSGATGCGVIVIEGGDDARVLNMHTHDCPTNGQVVVSLSGTIDNVLFRDYKSVDNAFGGIGAESQLNGTPITNITYLNGETSGNDLGGDFRFQGIDNFILDGHNGHDGDHGGGNIGPGEANNVCRGKIVNSFIGNTNAGLQTLVISGLVGGSGAQAGKTNQVEVYLDNLTLEGSGAGTGLDVTEDALVTGGTVISRKHTINLFADQEALVIIDKFISQESAGVGIDLSTTADISYALVETWGSTSAGITFRAGSDDSRVACRLGAKIDFTGSHDGSSGAAIMTDSTASFVIDDLIGKEIRNTTDGSTGTITDNTATTVTATLSGGTDDDWDASDAYEITNETGRDGIAQVGSPSGIEVDILQYTGTRFAKDIISGSVLNTWTLRNQGANNIFYLEDGISGPSSETGVAKMYVDVADGDLKIIFGDGTVKTIITDT